MRKLFHHPYFWFVSFLAVIIFIFREWFFTQSILTSSDWMFVFPESHEPLFYVPSAWLSTQLGGVNLFSYFFPVQAGMSLLNFFGHSYGFIERAFFMVPAILVGYTGMYALSKNILKHPFAGVVSALVFSFNTYALLIGTSHLTILVSMSLIPWIFLFFTTGLEKKSFWRIGLVSLLLAVSSAYEFRIFYITTFLIFFYYMYSLFITLENYKEKLLKTIYFLTAFIGAGAVNLYWLIGLSKAGTISANEYFSRELFGNGFMHIERAMTLFHPFWTGKAIAAFLIQATPWQFWLIPIVAFIGLYLGRKNKDVLFWGAIALLGIFLTKQANDPFPEAYEWLFVSFPGFNSFREASKFYLMISLGYSILIGNFIVAVSEYASQKKYTQYLSYGVMVVIASLFLFNAKPLLTKDIGALFIPRSMPSEYQTIKTFIEQDPQFFRTLWIPRKSRWSYYSANHPLVSFDEVFNSHWFPFIAEESNRLETTKMMLALMQQENFAHILRASGIRYVIAPLEDTENDDNFYEFYGDKSLFIETLAKNSALKKVDVGTQEIVVFELTQPMGRFSMTQQPISISEKRTNASHSAITSHRSSAYAYELEVRNVKQPFFLHFTDFYHPLWSIYADTPNPYPKKIIEVEHTKNEALMNTFSIDPTVLCEKVPCQKHDDGTMTLKFVLFFGLQYYYFIGIVLGALGCVVAFVSAYLAHVILKKYV